MTTTSLEPSAAPTGFPGPACFLAVRLDHPVSAEAVRAAARALVDTDPPGPADALVEVDGTALSDRELLAEVTERASAALPSGGAVRILLVRREAGAVLAVSVPPAPGGRWSPAALLYELVAFVADPTRPAGAASLADELSAVLPSTVRSHRGAEPVGDSRPAAGTDAAGDIGLRTDWPRDGAGGSHDVYAFRLPSAVQQALHGIAERQQVPLFTVLLAVTQCVLHLHTGTSDMVVDIPVRRRRRPAGSGWLDVVPHRQLVDGAASFSRHLAATDAALSATSATATAPDTSGDVPMGARGPGRVSVGLLMPRTPTQRAVLSLAEAVAGTRVSLHGRTVEVLAARHRPPADVDLVFITEETGLTGRVVFRADMFAPRSVSRLIDHLGRAAEAFSAAPQLAVSDSLGISAGEAAMVAGWNRTGTTYPRDSTVSDLFREKVRQAPEAPALAFGDCRYTYRQLGRVVNALAGDMVGKGVRPGDTVALDVDRSAAVPVAMLATALIGAAYVPIDPSYPANRRTHVVRAARASMVVTGPSAQPTDAIAGVPGLSVDRYLTPQVWNDPRHDDPPPTGALPESLLYVIHTSGSTGDPKGVAVTHRNVIRLVRESNFCQVRPGDRMAQLSNAAFDAATMEIWGALLNGAELVVYQRGTLVDPGALSAVLAADGITVAVVATPLFNQVVADNPRVFAPLRQLMVGGDAMDPRRARDVVRAGGPILVNGYGPTESTTFATTYRVPDDPLLPARVPIGSPISNTTVRILDGQLREQPIGVPGQVYIGGDGLARGYLNDPALTATRFVADPFADVPGSRMYATGDLARWLDDGTIDFLGRVDSQVKVRGYRIELNEIDRLILRHPEVHEAVTTVVGEAAEEKELAAYYSGPPQAVPDPGELRRWLAAELPEYMVPAVLERLPRLPKNANGKIDVVALRAGALPADGSMPTAVADVLETEVRELFADVLGHSEFGLDDSLFEVGGHSLVAMKLIGRLRNRYGVAIRLHELFEQATVRQLAAYLAAARVDRDADEQRVESNCQEDTRARS